MKYVPLAPCLLAACALAACDDLPTPRLIADSGSEPDSGDARLDAGQPTMDGGSVAVDAGRDAGETGDSEMDATAPVEAGPPEVDAAEPEVDAGEPVGLAERPANGSCVLWAEDPGPPQMLSDTGCFDGDDPNIPLEALLPFDLNAALWSDWADKQRFLVLPDGAQIEVAADGDFLFPVGTMLVKTFSINGIKLETRFLVRYPDKDMEQNWAGFAWDWNDLQTDAELVPDGPTMPFDIAGKVPNQQWTIPARDECMNCHNRASGRALGPELIQINREFAYRGNVRANQLHTWRALGMFSNPPEGSVADLGRLLPYDSEDDQYVPTITNEERAKSYLHINCALCHRDAEMLPADVPEEVTDDFRIQQTLPNMGICDVVPALDTVGIAEADARILAPGSADNSVMYARMNCDQDCIDNIGEYRMPPVATALVDPLGTQIIQTWINGLTVGECTE